MPKRTTRESKKMAAAARVEEEEDEDDDGEVPAQKKKTTRLTWTNMMIEALLCEALTHNPFTCAAWKMTETYTALRAAAFSHRRLSSGDRCARDRRCPF